MPLDVIRIFLAIWEHVWYRSIFVMHTTLPCSNQGFTYSCPVFPRIPNVILWAIGIGHGSESPVKKLSKQKVLGIVSSLRSVGLHFYHEVLYILFLFYFS
uniref:Predicted protein n=1 Tax=Hordeum vulgare subsp. vulgare TaxID=112509 RepID=F2E856_HORVV|nr:predicted protein [Hordeum vulgare subsp. vulgare]